MLFWHVVVHIGEPGAQVAIGYDLVTVMELVIFRQVFHGGAESPTREFASPRLYIVFGSQWPLGINYSLAARKFLVQLNVSKIFQETVP